MSRICAVALLLSLALKGCFSDTKLKDVLWNSGRSNFNRSNNNEEDENVMKSEVKNVLKLCSSKYKNEDNDSNNDNNRYHGNGQPSDTYRRITQNGNYYKNFGYYDYENQQDKNSRNKHSSNNGDYNTRNDGNTNNDNNSNNNNSGYRNRNNNYNSGSYGNSNNNNDDPYSSYGTSSSYNSNSRNNNNYDQQYSGMVTITCKCPPSPSSSYQSRFDSYSNSNDRSRNGNSYDSRSNGYGTRSAAGYNSENSNGYGNYGYGTDRTQQETSYGYNNRGRNDGYDGYIGTMSYARRTKREKNNEYSNNRDDFECTSQCVFGQMELLDDDQTPSETLVIKWIQDHIPNDDMKRIKSLREVRKCFTRMSTTSIDDNCDYSNELAKCLNLEFD